MQEIINLLEQKNHHLERFLKQNENEILNFSEGNFDNLERFYNSREVILDIVGCLDRMVEEAQCKTKSSEAGGELKKHLIEALDKKNSLVTEILSQDLQILALIEKAKSDIIKELSQVKTARKAIGSYKSGERKSTLREKA